MDRRDFFKIIPALAVSSGAVLKALQMRHTYGLIRPIDPISWRVKQVFLDGVDLMKSHYVADVNDKEGWVDVLICDENKRRLFQKPRRMYGDVRVVVDNSLPKPRDRLIKGPALDWDSLTEPTDYSKLLQIPVKLAEQARRSQG